MASTYRVTTEGAEPLTAATPETILQLRGATAVKAKITHWSVSFNGTNPSAEPIRVRLLRQTADGTGTAATEVKDDPDSPDANCTAFHTFSSTEPTAGDVLEDVYVHPQSSYTIQYPLGREPSLDNATTSRIGLECNAPAAVSCVASLGWEE